VITKRFLLARRLGLGVTDQVLSSFTNFVVSFGVARSVGTRGLGIFGLAFATYAVALGVSRALNTDPVVVRHSASTPDEWRRATSTATGAAVGFGLAVGAALAVGSLALRGETAAVFRVLALGLPALLLQDAWRWSFVAARRTGAAVVNDLVWALTLVPSLVVLAATDRASTTNLTIAWVTAAGVAALVGLLQAHLVPTPLAPWGWWRAHRDLGPRYLGEFVVSGGVTELIFYAVGAIAGLVALGSLRAAWLMIGPFNVVLMGIVLVAVPEVARLRVRAPERLVGACVLVSAALAGLVVALTAVLLSVPEGAGRRLLGANWEVGRAVLVPVALYTLSSAAATGASIGLRALAAAKRSFAARLAVAPVMIGAALTGSAVAGASGAAWGMAAANSIAVVVWWRQLAAARLEHA